MPSITGSKTILEIGKTSLPRKHIIQVDLWERRKGRCVRKWTDDSSDKLHSRVADVGRIGLNREDFRHVVERATATPWTFQNDDEDAIDVFSRLFQPLHFSLRNFLTICVSCTCQFPVTHNLRSLL